MALCPCGSEVEYDKCCGMYITAGIPVPTAEKLMRARYTAYALNEIDFIMDTHVVEEGEEEASRQATAEWASESEWQGLEILKCTKGKESDLKGTVEFKAHYMVERARYTHHEISKFEKREGKWIFTEGTQVSKPIVNTEAKVGRNDPCPCGSGKKYKKCCA